jgi:hypothetical protein
MAQTPVIDRRDRTAEVAACPRTASTAVKFDPGDS